MYKVAVLGDRDSIYGFASVGMEIFPITAAAEAERKIKTLADDGYAIIYITESLCEQIEETLDNYQSKPLPAIIPIPGITGNTGVGVERVKKSVKKAVGSDIIYNEK